MSRNYIQCNPDSQVPKYRQIIQSVKWALERKILKKGDKIPSINHLCSSYNLSRDTVMMAYNDLKAHGIIASKKGKGYFIESTDTQCVEKVFLQLDELDSGKEEFYNSFNESLKFDASIDIFVHRGNYQLFKNQLTDCIGKYTSYVIMPVFFDNIGHLIRKLPVDKVYILDRNRPEFNEYSSVYQDFESDMYDSLQKLKGLLAKYRRLVYVTSGMNEPSEKLVGFKRYCIENQTEYKVVTALSDIQPALYDAFFVSSDNILVELLKKVQGYEYEVGSKFGIISFKENSLKEVVAGGITTISPDYAQMGRSLAEMVLNRRHKQVKNSANVVVRNSL